jgi:hypothetical protein
MRKVISLLFVLGVFLSACGVASTQPAPPSQTGTPTVTLTATQTPTATITPLPTIATFTPTFDVSSIVTVTPAEKAECPKENPELEPNFNFCSLGDCSGYPFTEEILQFINLGGLLNKVEPFGNVVDLTGDGVKEIVYEGFTLTVYGCKDRKYDALLEIEGTQHAPYLDKIIDLNNNGLPELIISNYERRAFHSIRILEWVGNEFRSLIEIKFISFSNNPNGEIIRYDWLGGTTLNYNIVDSNKDGIKEIVAVDEIPVYDPGDLSRGLPWREETIILSWDGNNYVVANIEYSPPQYQFQSIQEGDRFTAMQRYKESL